MRESVLLPDNTFLSDVQLSKVCKNELKCLLGNYLLGVRHSTSGWHR